MSKNTLSFESENLVVDYISFKFQDLKDWKEKELVSYLLKLGFNCYKESGKLRKPIKTLIFMGVEMYLNGSIFFSFNFLKNYYTKTRDRQINIV